MNNPSYLFCPIQALSGKSNSSECFEIRIPWICFETTRWSVMNLLKDLFDTFSKPRRQPLGQNHGSTWKVSNRAYNFWVCDILIAARFWRFHFTGCQGRRWQKASCDGHSWSAGNVDRIRDMVSLRIQPFHLSKANDRRTTQWRL